MNVKKEIIETIQELKRRREFKSQASIAEALGYNPSYFSRTLNSDIIPIDFEETFFNRFPKSVYLNSKREATPKIEDFSNSNEEEGPYVGDIIKSNGIAAEESVHPLNVTIIPAKAQLGLQSFIYAEELMNELEVRTIYRNKLYKGTYYEIECRGDSMNNGSSESINDGDFVLCREISRLYWKDKLHINDWIFAIFHKEHGIIVKQILEHNTTTGDLLLHSFNQDKEEYPDFTINIRDCEKICNVVEVRKVKRGKYGY